MLQDLTQEDIVDIVERWNVDFVSGTADTIRTILIQYCDLPRITTCKIEGIGGAIAFR